MSSTDPKMLHELSMNNSNNAKIYDIWASTYNEYVNEIEYNAPQSLLTLLSDYLEQFEHIATTTSTTEMNTDKITNRFKSILDFGCGTGLVGKELKASQNKTISTIYNNAFLLGIDISEKMVEKSIATKAYSNFIIHDLTKEHELVQIKQIINSYNYTKTPLNGFDLIISCGVFLEGHVPLPFITRSLVYLLNPNGLLIITIRNSYLNANSDFMKQLKAIPFLEIVIEKQIAYLKDVDALCLIIKNIAI